MPKYQREIQRLEQLINSATRNVSTDGLSTGFDLDAARKRLAELKRLADPAVSRQTVAGLTLGGCW